MNGAINTLVMRANDKNIKFDRLLADDGFMMFTTNNETLSRCLFINRFKQIITERYSLYRMRIFMSELD